MKILLITLIILFSLLGCSEENTELQEGDVLSAEINPSPNSTIVPNTFSMPSVSNSNDTELLKKEDNSESKVNNEQLLSSEISKDEPQLLKSYSTKILTSDNNRYHNISLVADRLNDYILPAGAVFSFNKVCGPYGQSDGFLEATILLSDGTEAKGFGGGVCQLSSTLYNAVKDLNVTITEHHHHSKPVAYVPANQDATVSLQSDLDFKFRNDYSTSLIFKTNHDPNNVSISVFKLGDAP